MFFRPSSPVKKKVKLQPIIKTELRSSAVEQPQKAARAGVTVRQLSEAFATMEGYYKKGSMAQKRRNPGNIKSKTRRGVFMTYKSEEEGFMALDTLLREYSPWSLSRTVHRYAPESDNNNPAAYTAFVANKLGIDPHVPLKDILIDI